MAVAFALFCAQRIHWAYGVIRDHYASNATAVPGEEEFHAANRKIIRFEDKVAFGNSLEAERLAALFSTAIQDARQVAITAGNPSAFSLSKQRFLTYCRLNSDSCVFLVHVPELRRYTDEARIAIANLAWSTAQNIAQDAGLSSDARVAVGVKRLLNYESILIGRISGPGSPLDDITQQERGLGLNKIHLLFPFFADDKVTASVPLAADASRPPISPPSPGQIVPYADYHGLLGEDYQGNVFFINLHQRRWAVMSRHQFEDDAAPNMAEDIIAERTIALQASAVVRQRDVQLVPLADQSLPLPCLAFDPVFELEVGEKLWIERGGKKGTTGTLLPQGLRHGRYSALDGSKNLSMRLDAPTDVRGASGSPIIRLKTGLPIGVLLSADDGQAARTIVFEPICVVEKISGPPLDDTRIAEMIPGVWIEDFTRLGKPVVNSLHFRQDGTYFSHVPDVNTPSPKVRFEGRWKIENATLIYYANRNSIDIPATPVKDRIVALGEDYLVYPLPDGVRLLMRKISSDPMTTTPPSPGL